jgi:hypothetical protein
VARDEAAKVGHSARDAGSHVAQTATDQARQVVSEAGRQARDLLGEAKGQAREQASTQQHKAAQQLRTVADELSEMAAKSGQSGLATQVAQEAAERARGVASWLDQREPGDLLDGVRDFARRRPGAFLVGAAVAGLVAGRLTRGLTGATGPNGQPGPQPRTVSELPLAADAPTMADPVPPLPGDSVPGPAMGGVSGQTAAGRGYPRGGSAAHGPDQP